MRYTDILCVSVAACLSWPVVRSAPAYADLGDQLFKLLPDDGAPFDHFGCSVAISGPTAIVGALDDDDNGTASGSAYLFDTTTGRQIAKLLPNDGAAGDIFGWSVAISGVTAIVGAYWDDDNGSNSGSAYLFDPTTGRQIAKLLANDGAGSDLFGYSVAISGPTAIVGARRDDDNGNDSGSAYIFDTTTGRQIAKLLPNDGAADDVFGNSVAISGATVVVGAPGHDDNGFDSGSAYLFNATTGRQIAKLLADDGAEGDHFGTSVAISGATAIVGAVTDNDNHTGSGSAYLFDTTTGRQIAKLLLNDGAADDLFGYSVAISGDTAIVGAYLDDDDGSTSGSASIFQRDFGGPNNWGQVVKLTASDAAAIDWFGFSVAISGAPGKGIAIVGALADDDNGINSGSAYLFDASSCPWDFDDNAVVGVSDLLALLASWGPCPPKGNCPADFDGNGNVGVKDLLILLGNWGPCL